jgi:hypothetical protein
MIGALLTLLFAAGVAFLGQSVIARRFEELDSLESYGLGGLLGLLVVGVLTFFVGMAGLLSVAVAGALFIVALVGGGLALRSAPPKFGRPDALSALALGVIGLVALVGVATPTTEWDSLAYHLAVPKLWLEAGRINPVLAIHHSYFPFAADNLYIWGLAWGGEYGAKAFSLAFFLLGCLSLFGLARRWSGVPAARWTTILYAGCPVIAWEAGTAYIDVAHGLYAGLGILYAAERFTDKRSGIPWLPILLLGGGLATKHTGLQILAATGCAILIAAVLQRETRRGLTFAATLALSLAIALPWYARTAALQGNPVYPFFYGILGGRDWDEWRASIYANEQKSFGVPGAANLGHAVLGLGYQPGRYTNPRQTEGGGFPSGALGAGIVVAGLAAAALRGGGRKERLALAAVGVSLLIWFGLSQQSRYLAVIAVPIAAVAGMTLRDRREPAYLAVGVLASLQWAYTLGYLFRTETETRLLVLTGQASPAAYRKAYVPFAEDAEKLNQLPVTSKIALYDEVFGFLLDRPYMWANPGHSTTIPYENVDSGAEYVEAMRGLGFTHLYVSLRFSAKQDRDRWLAAAGLIPGEAYPPDEAEQMKSNLDLKWKWLIADALRSGHLGRVSQGNGALIIEVPNPNGTQR